MPTPFDDDTPAPAAELLLAFDLAPVGLMVSRHRVVRTCNQAFCAMFGYAPGELAGQSLERLYPSGNEYEHTGQRALPAMRATGLYADERIMRRADGSLFWCHVTGRAMDLGDPFAAAVWAFEDLSAARPVSAGLTVRERQIARLIAAGSTSKEIARELHISHRTVDAHRARLLRKFGVGSAAELVARLVGQV